MPTLKICNLKCHNMCLKGNKPPNVFIVVDVDGKWTKTSAQRASNFSEIPSPLVTGILDER